MMKMIVLVLTMLTLSSCVDFTKNAQTACKRLINIARNSTDSLTVMLVMVSNNPCYHWLVEMEKSTP